MSIDSQRRTTLEERVIKLFIEKQTNSQEFQTYLTIYGRKKLESIWIKYRERLAHEANRANAKPHQPQSQPSREEKEGAKDGSLRANTDDDF